MDKIIGYSAVTDSFEFVHKGAGHSPWSLRYDHKDGRVIEIRNSEWTLFSKNQMCYEGKTPKGLKKALLAELNKDELINLFLKEK